MTTERFTALVEVTVRPCTAADLPNLEWFGAFTHHRAIIAEAFALQTAGQVLMLVADVRGFPVGQIWLDLRPREISDLPMAWALRVMEPFRGLGIGARLMAAVEAAAADCGYDRIELGVEKDNPGARALYERLGWGVTGERRESYSYLTPEGLAATHLLDEWVMQKTLTPEG